MERLSLARGYVDASRAASTRRAYRGDWTRFEAWCREQAVPALPASPALVAVYLSTLATNGLAPPSVAPRPTRAAKAPRSRCPEGRRLTPLAHLCAWLDAARILEGPVFRPLWKSGRVRPVRLSDHAMARIVQARARAAGLGPRRYAGHSLRAGFVTAAARAGSDLWKIQQVSRHTSMQVLAGDVRDARLFDDHAGDGFL